MRIRIQDPESFWPWIREPGWKNSDQGSGMINPDPQHRENLMCYMKSANRYWILGERLAQNHRKYELTFCRIAMEAASPTWRLSTKIPLKIPLLYCISKKSKKTPTWVFSLCSWIIALIYAVRFLSYSALLGITSTTYHMFVWELLSNHNFCILSGLKIKNKETNFFECNSVGMLIITGFTVVLLTWIMPSSFQKETDYFNWDVHNNYMIWYNNCVILSHLKQRGNRWEWRRIAWRENN